MHVKLEFYSMEFQRPNILRSGTPAPVTVQNFSNCAFGLGVLFNGIQI